MNQALSILLLFKTNLPFLTLNDLVLVLLPCFRATYLLRVFVKL
jgi:hypothetical protein